jgi:aspartate/methionine/tyrosine aminotransferase
MHHDLHLAPALNHLRPVVAGLEGSLIREVANAGMGRTDVLKFWFGESDAVTPETVRQAAVASLLAGETFYAHNLGLPELRAEIAAYTARLHPQQGAEHWLDRTVVTSGGVNGLMLAAQAVVEAGDEVAVVTPIWPNLVQQARVMGGVIKPVPLQVRDGAWVLDMAALQAAVTPATRLLVLNAPNNPTGWTLSRDEQQAILNHCRQTGTWILADEVYERLYYGEAAQGAPISAPGRPKPNASPGGCGEAAQGGPISAPGRPKPNASPGGCGEAAQEVPISAPSFLDIAEPEDRLLVAHSFSKSFLMTGWRLGWLVVPPSVLEQMGKLVEFNTSCAPVFVQRGAAQALRGEADITPALVAHLQTCRDTLVDALLQVPGLTLARPLGGMYAFFRVDGQGDSLTLAKRLVTEAGLGLAPGSAFGPEAEGWLRWCFASQQTDRLLQGVDRLSGWLRRAGL